MKKTKKTVAEQSAAFANAFPRHPHHDAFLEAAIALRAKDLAAAAEPLTPHQAMASARAEFKSALHAVLFPPTENRFYFLWATADHARLLTKYTQAVWTSAPGKYGERQPVHYDAKRNPDKQN